MATTIRITVYAAESISEANHLSTPDRMRIASQIADEARAAAPVLTGAFRDGIGITADGDTIRVVDEDPDAGYKEYGTSDTPAHATLTSTASEFGRYSGIRPRGSRAGTKSQPVHVSARVPHRRGKGR
jgi:hypothetical protein